MDPGGRCSASTSSEGHGACAGQVASSLAGCPLGKGWRLSGQGRGGEGGEGSLCSSVRVTRVRSLAVVNRAFWRDTDPSKIGGPAKEEQGVGALGCWVWPKWGHVGPGHPLPPTLAAAAGLGLQGKPWAGETALLSGGQRCQGGGTEAGGGQTTLLRAPRAVRLLGAWWCRWPGAACGFGEGTAWSPPLVRGFLCLFSARPEPQTLKNGLGKRASVALCPPCCPSLRTLAFHPL